MKKHTLLKKMPVEMKVGKCRMQYMHDTINEKLKPHKVLNTSIMVIIILQL